MKKIMNIALGVACFGGNLLGAENNEYLKRRSEGMLTSSVNELLTTSRHKPICSYGWEDLIVGIRTQEDMCRFVRSHIEYKEGPFDEKAKGKEIWKRGYGNCKDISACIQEICEEKQWPSTTYCLFTENEKVGHMIVVGSIENKMWFSNNGEYSECWSLKDIKEETCRVLGWNPRSTMMDKYKGKKHKYYSFVFDNHPEKSNRFVGAIRDFVGGEKYVGAIRDFVNN